MSNITVVRSLFQKDKKTWTRWKFGKGIKANHPLRLMLQLLGHEPTKESKLFVYYETKGDCINKREIERKQVDSNAEGAEVQGVLGPDIL